MQGEGDYLGYVLDSVLIKKVGWRLFEEISHLFAWNIFHSTSYKEQDKLCAVSNLEQSKVLSVTIQMKATEH